MLTKNFHASKRLFVSFHGVVHGWESYENYFCSYFQYSHVKWRTICKNTYLLTSFSVMALVLVFNISKWG